MKKDRNSFFQETLAYNQSSFPNMNIANNPFANNIYAGPTPNNGMPLNYNTPIYQNQNYNDNYSDIEARLAKIERQISRLDARISKLENGNLYPNEDMNETNNVYML